MSFSNLTICSVGCYTIWTSSYDNILLWQHPLVLCTAKREFSSLTICSVGCYSVDVILWQRPSDVFCHSCVTAKTFFKYLCLYNLTMFSAGCRSLTMFSAGCRILTMILCFPGEQSFLGWFCYCAALEVSSFPWLLCAVEGSLEAFISSDCICWGGSVRSMHAKR